MAENHFITLEELEKIKPDPSGRLHSATHEEITRGLTTDIYFVRTRELLEQMKLADTEVTAEVFSSRSGVLAGIEEVLNLLRGLDLDIQAVPEGEMINPKEVVLRIRGRYSTFGIYETPILGMLASASGWATAARECKEAAAGKEVYCFGARHVHPAVAPVMERAAAIGGVDGCSCILGARMIGQLPAGTVPHAAFLIAGDTVKLAEAYHRFMPAHVPRIILVDTFKDEAEEALRVAEALGEHLGGIRLDTPSERGGVTADLVKEVRARLDQAGFHGIRILVSGGLKPERIALLAQAGADFFGVGSFIAGAPPIDMTMDLKEIAGKPVAKRGRIPGITINSRLKKVTR